MTQHASQLGRISGALLLHSGGGFYLIGNLKEPCDFRGHGFVKPAEEIDACAHPFVRLEALEGTSIAHDALPIATAIKGEALAQVIAKRLLITRNGSVSDRLWRLITGVDADGDVAANANVHTDVSWLVQMPDVIWNIVRDTVLRCS